MPTVSDDNLALLRTYPHKTKLYAVVYQPRVIWSARVDGGHSRGDQTILVTSVVAVRVPRQHFQVLLGATAGGDERGQARFRDYDSGTTTLTLSPNNAALQDGDYITVLEEVKPASIIPKMQAAGAIFEDGNLSYGTQNVDYQQIAGFGPPFVGFIDPDTLVATAQFFGYGRAFADGATIDDWAFNFTSAASPTTASVQGSAGSPNETDFPAGQYYVRLVTTDSNGTIHRTYRPAFAIDRSDHSQYYDQLEITQLEGDAESGGWSCGITVYGDATEDEFPPQALVVLFAEDWYGATAGSIGGDYAFRENIVFVGYIREDSIQKKAVGGSVSFSIDGIGKLMDAMLSFPANLTSVSGTPANWHELQDLNFDRAAHHIITQHSTLDLCCDVVFDTKDYALASVDLTESSLRDQLNNQLYTAVRARVGSSRSGRLYCSSYPQLFPRSERTQPVVIDATFTDLAVQLDLGAERNEKQTAQIDFAGFNAAADQVFYSLAPGAQWSTGTVEKVDGIRVDDQDEANAIAGIWAGYLNADYKQIVAQWRGNYRIFDVFPPEAVKLTLAAGDTNRGIVWTSKKTYPTRVTFDVRPSGLFVTTGLEKDSGGRLGISNNSDIGGDDPSQTDPPAGITVAPPSPVLLTPPIDPLTVAFAPYDVLDGFNGSIFAGVTQEMLYGVTARAWTIHTVNLYCPDSDVTLLLDVNGSTVITATRAAGDWTINGASAGSGDTVSDFALASPVSISGAGLTFRTAIVADGTIARLGYGFGGSAA